MMTLREGPWGTLILKNDDGRTMLFQTDWDLPGLAASFGYVACHCGATDGTIDCEHRTAFAMIAEARTYLDRCIGMRIEDPGYF